MRHFLAWGAGLLLLLGCSVPGTPLANSSTPVAPGVAPGPTATATAAPFQGALPEYATKNEKTEQLYRWAATNRHILQYFQCTCGCESDGHTSNWNCYVKAEKPGSEFDWDPMSAG